MGTLEGKVGLVTGSGSGIGRATALAMVREGAKVIVSDVDDKGGAETVKMISDAGGDGFFVHADVSDPKQVEALVKAAVDKYGALHLGVNNAGIGGESATVGDYSVEGWRKVMSINLDGVFYSMKYEIQAMLAAGGGAIVNISSILGLVAFPQASAYTSAKHGVVGLTKAAAIEYGQAGIRVNAINPGFIATPLLTGAGNGHVRVHRGQARHEPSRFRRGDRRRHRLAAVGQGLVRDRHPVPDRRRLHGSVGSDPTLDDLPGHTSALSRDRP
jgi:NAD(P)-dependent dehydrogenase (short-subunit alcohol dehydrogenase family)